MKRIAVAAWLAACPAAQACGVCIEDKVAATYDFGVVTRTLQAGRSMVFAEVKGDADAGTRTRAALAAAKGVRGIESGSLRASLEPATISFALDESVLAPPAALAAVQRRAAGTRLELVKVLR